MDAEIFKKIFLPYYQKLYRIAFRLLQDEAEAEDMVQDAYIKLWDKRNDLADIDNTEAFAIVVLRNLCLDQLRKSKDHLHAKYEVDIPEQLSLIGQVETLDELDYVRQLVEQLPEQQRQIMLFKHWDGYSDEEIEQITGMSAGNIRVSLSRARKSIREQFKMLSKNEN